MGRMLYRISFASEERFLGVVIVEADTLTGALALRRLRRGGVRGPERGGIATRRGRTATSAGCALSGCICRGLSWLAYGH